MFYFIGVTSDIEQEEHKRRVNEALLNLYEDLRTSIHWEETYNNEMMIDKEPSDYVELMDVINRILCLT